MASKTILLAANGVLAEKQIRAISPASLDKIVATDGAAIQLLRLGIRPDVIIGDLDSLTEEELKAFSGSQIIHRPSQELNDLEKALQYCREQQAEKLLIFGVTGKRQDHTLTNFSVLARYRQFSSLEIITPHATVFLVNQTFEYVGNPGQIISLLPFGRAEGVRTSGLRFPLNDETLELGTREGLSNEILQGKIRVSLRNGLLLIFLNHDVL